MSERWDVHHCTIREGEAQDQLPFKIRLKEAVRKLVLANPDSVRSLQFYTTMEIMEERDKQIRSGSWMVHPCSLFTVYFQVWMVFVLFVSLTYRFLDICFIPEVTNRLLVDDFFFTMDLVFIVVNLRTGFVDDQKECIVMDQKAIIRSNLLTVLVLWSFFRRYMYRFLFFADFLVLISDIPGFRLSFWYMEVLNNLGLLRLVRIPTFFRYWRRTCQYFRISYFTYVLTRDLLLTIMALEYITCIIYFTWLYESGRVFNFGRVENVTELSIVEFMDAYVIGTWWAASYMIGIDIGFDATTFYCLSGITSIIFGRFIHYYLMVTILSVFLGNDPESRYYQMMNEVNKYMTTRKFPLKLQQKMHLYYSYKYMRRYIHESHIRRSLSETLNREINYHHCQTILKHANILQSVKEDMVVTLLSHFSHEIYLPNDIIIQAGALGDSMFFIGSGTVAMFAPSGKEIFHLQDGDSFGAHCVLMAGQRRFVTVIALQICELYKLNRRTFRKFLNEDSDLVEKLERQSKQRRQLVTEVEAMYHS